MKRAYQISRQKGSRKLLSRVLREISKSALTILYRLKVVRNNNISVSLLRIHFWVLKNLSPSFSDADPLKIIYVDPSKIEYHYHGNPQQFGSVEAGDWDMTDEKFDSTGKYDPNLAEKIELEGYQSQRELFSKYPDKTWRKNNDAVHPYLNEIAINIGRDGRMGKKSSGSHRLSVAKELELDEVPVVVRARHRDWQKIRDQIRTTDAVNDLPETVTRHLDHPDLQDLSPR